MKVLILSISAGGGHKQAAEAIKSYTLFNSPDSQIEIIDTFKYINPLLDKVVIGSYLKSIKLSPSIFGRLYNFSEKDESLMHFTNKFNEIIGLRVIALIKNSNPDIIIATHPFSTQMLSVLKVKYELKMPLISILTDYAPHSFWIHPHIDAYVVSNKDMKYEMIERGVNENIIYDLGIPVNPNFTKVHSRKKTLENLNLSEKIPTVLIMGGTLGMGKISSIYEDLANMKTNVQIIVITGKNKRLYSEILRLKTSVKNPTVVIGYTKEVNKYMQACDILLTKPGGLTITEAIISHTPLVLFSPIPGPEEQNVIFLLKHNLALYISDNQQIKSSIENLLHNPETLENLKFNCREFAKPNAGNAVYKLMSELVLHKKVNPEFK